jgi:hypothetical protein
MNTFQAGLDLLMSGLLVGLVAGLFACLTKVRG